VAFARQGGGTELSGTPGKPRPDRGIDVSQPNVARVYNYFIGGKDHFAADREYAHRVMDLSPFAESGARIGREFLRRVVRYLVAEAGVTQLLDIGSGLPVPGSVSEIAHEADPAVRVVHVDNDPVVYTHSKALLSRAATVDVLQADVRRPAELLADPVVQRLVDFSQPVGLLLFAVLHHIGDEDKPAAIIDALRDAMPPGSYLAISSLRMAGEDLPELRAEMKEGVKKLKGTPASVRWREEAEIQAYFGDWEMIPPGLVPLMEWRPPIPRKLPRDGLYHSYSGGVARKPG
jgi:hypothetical protein